MFFRIQLARRASVRGLLLIALLGSYFVLVACDKRVVAEIESTAMTPEDLRGKECAACGMVVAEQPAPRGQLVRRDGTREFFCSVGDMHVHLNIPSPHGKPALIWVETLPSSMKLDDRELQEQPWKNVNDVVFITGVKRKGIMGKPVLVQETQAEALTMAKRLGGIPESWSSLLGK
ncbi:MAG: hypothetical protein GY822_02550 [Deltaproteobacteria bacterium]|nr:hypothetical protein [Deltaproteobacteria bacterium]